MLLSSVPLCYVYPAMLHYKACARTRFQKVADIILMIFGLAAAAYTTVQTIVVRYSDFDGSQKLTSDNPLQLMAEPSSGAPQFGRCETTPLLI